MNKVAPLPLRMWPALRERAWAYSRPRVPGVVYTNGGLGDELMLTAIAHTARLAGRPLHILTNFPEIWRGNRDPLSLQTDVERWHYASRRRWISTHVRHLSYSGNSRLHIAAQMAAHLDLTLPAAWRPILAAASRPARSPRRLVVQNSCRGARYASDTKEWPQDRWQALLEHLTSEFEVIQIGTAADPALRGVEDLRGQTTLFAAAEIIAGAALFVGLESGLMHVAAAMHTPAVIIHGGRTFVEQTGYPFNLHLVRTPPCAGCSLNTGCMHQLRCLDIPVDEVVSAVRLQLQINHPHP